MMANSARRAGHDERTALEHERSILITKLRWIGLVQEADRMTAAGETPAAMTMPEETD